MLAQSSLGSDPGAPRETPGPGLRVSDGAVLLLALLAVLHRGAPHLPLTARVSLVDAEKIFILYKHHHIRYIINYDSATL